jgi:hypothetical protein
MTDTQCSSGTAPVRHPAGCACDRCEGRPLSRSRLREPLRSSSGNVELADKLAAVPLDQLHFGWPTTVPIRLSETERELIVNVLRGVAQAAPEPVAYQFRQRSGVGEGPQNQAPWCDWCGIEREDYDNYVRHPNKLVEVRPLYAALSLVSSTYCPQAQAGETEPFTVQDAWDRLVHKDDRTSPEEYPEMCLITFDELQDFMVHATNAPLMIPEELEYHRKPYFGLARCIASVSSEYRADLCRYFRINPKDVEASANSGNPMTDIMINT